MEKLDPLHEKEYEEYVKVPSRLPTNIAVLQSKLEELQIDVWPNPEGPPAPQYVTNAIVRKAVNGVLRLERCNEEELRLTLEATNLLRWLPFYRAALLIALGQPYSKW